MAEVASPVAGTLGSFIISLCFAYMVYGIVVAQSYVYSLNCKHDSTEMKILVSLVTFLEALHTAFVVHITYHFFITGYGNLEVIATTFWSPGAAVFTENAILVLVQGFYIRRVWILSKRNWFLTGLIAFLVGTRIIFGIITGALAETAATWTEFHAKILPLVTINVADGLSVLADGLIAGSLIYYLRREKRGFNPGTDNMLSWLMTYSVNTGLITMLASLGVMLTFVTLKENMIFLGINLISSKLYANSMLGTLNARRILRGKVVANPSSIGYNLSELSSSNHTKSQPIEILRERTQITDAPYAMEDLSTKKPSTLDA